MAARDSRAPTPPPAAADASDPQQATVLAGTGAGDRGEDVQAASDALLQTGHATYHGSGSLQLMQRGASMPSPGSPAELLEHETTGEYCIRLVGVECSPSVVPSAQQLRQLWMQLPVRHCSGKAANLSS